MLSETSAIELKGTEYFVSIYPSVVLTEWHNVMVNSDELIGTAEYLMLKARCRINVALVTGFDYIHNRIKLQPNQKHTVIYLFNPFCACSSIIGTVVTWGLFISYCSKSSLSLIFSHIFAS
jgi:hypothetical protein